ncbi:uncharacterized protein LOC101851996 isoform X1 [Aplysia californica]|uniref:Uncharacterized protein LOC101851996 isoform X1 n=1 Tax=Aplysia californica TaxID=6500 RepID=A0ABM0JCP5_APLCA|nr:uncharacterized protein LOC101851996 isoform X2 [Aplysia californica]XP_005090648.1 uncharacterized protein LOC101851996 isoform X2 [Aplysia californica]XP_005090649.1 uncharacterized protein LOC101851996 isoform X1 [Aplysia californica]
MSWTCERLWLLLVLLVPLCLSLRYTDYMTSPEYRHDALKTLRNIKKRLQPSMSVSRRSGYSEQKCRLWNDPCEPWTSDPSRACCNPRRHVCQCNLWLQNCRCGTRLWG